MKTETLKINIPTGFMIDGFDPATNEIKLKPKPKNVIERILTDDDVFADNGLTRDQFANMCEGLEAHEVAYRFIDLLNKSLNEGWTPDFDNSSQTKYEPMFFGGSSGFRFYDYVTWYSFSGVGSRLCFKSRELAQHAGNKFIKWYKQIIVINQIISPNGNTKN